MEVTVLINKMVTMIFARKKARIISTIFFSMGINKEYDMSIVCNYISLFYNKLDTIYRILNFLFNSFHFKGHEQRVFMKNVNDIVSILFLTISFHIRLDIEFPFEPCIIHIAYGSKDGSLLPRSIMFTETPCDPPQNHLDHDHLVHSYYQNI